MILMASYSKIDMKNNTSCFVAWACALHTVDHLGPFCHGGRYADTLFIWVKTHFLPNSNVVVGAGADAALGVAEGSQRLHPCLS